MIPSKPVGGGAFLHPSCLTLGQVSKCSHRTTSFGGAIPALGWPIFLPV